MPIQDDSADQVIARFSQFIVARINSFRYRDYGLEQSDLAQDIFIRIWEYYKKNDKNIRHLKSYICKIVNSVVIDAIKESRKEGETLAKLGRNLRADEDCPGLRGHGHDDNLRAVVLTSLKQLRVSRRKVISLYLTGLTLDEITDLMGWKRTKTNNLFYRGLEDLRKRLAAKEIYYED